MIAMKIIESINARINNYSVLSNILRDYLRVASDPVRHVQRIIASKSFSNSDLRIDTRSGFLLTNASQFEGLSELISKLQPFAFLRAEDLKGEHQVSPKPYYFNILDRGDVQSMPEIISFALSQSVLDILAPYYGLVPNLSHIGIFLSAHTGDTVSGTQHAHWDNHDCRHVKMFCYLSDVGPNDGPLTFLPADKSLWLRKKTGRILSTRAIRDDSEWQRYFTEKDLVKVIGPAGTVAFLNTSECMHFGSRCNPGGRRLSLVLHYAKFAEYSSTRTRIYQDLNVATSPELMPQNLNKAASLMFQIINPKN